jgi:transcriptional regulator with XRE-family HTH domain
MDLGLTQGVVARQLGVDPVTILNWEKNKTEPGAAHMRAVSEFLGYFPGAVSADLPSRIRAARHVLGLSQEKLAERLGISDSTVRKWERGRKRLYPRLLQLFQRVIEDSRLDEVARLPLAEQHPTRNPDSLLPRLAGQLE